MTKTTVADPTAVQARTINIPPDGEKGHEEMLVDREGDDYVFVYGNNQEYRIAVSQLREVCFDRKDKSQFSVIAEIFNKGSGGFTRTAGVTNKIIGVIEEKELSEFESKLDQLSIATLYLSR